MTWADSDEEGLFWQQDRMHAPEPVAPLDEEVWVLAYRGFDAAAATYEMPIRAHARRVNTYLYMAIAPAVPPDQMEVLGKRGEERLNEAMGRLESSWRDEWLPEVQSNLAWWGDLRSPWSVYDKPDGAPQRDGDAAGADLADPFSHRPSGVQRDERVR